MKIKRRQWIFLVAVLLLISMACQVSLKNSQPSEEDINMELTLQALQKTQTAAAAPASNDAKPDESSSDDPDIEDTDEPDEDEPDEDDDTCNQSKFVSETIPDGSVYQPGDTFTKTWVIRNNGTCDWTTDYRFVFEEGDQMDGPSSMKLDHVVEPGDTYTFEIDLTAPDNNGDYTGVWRIKSDDGEELGKYWVKITVGPAGPPPAAFAVTGVTFYMPHTTIDMGCPGDLAISGEITTSAAGHVTYYWIDSDGGQSPTNAFDFDAAGKKIANYTMTVNVSGDHWAKIYIDEPNHQYFGPINFHVNCVP
jgi:hypothetical protein